MNSIAGSAVSNGYNIGDLGSFTAQTIPPNSQGVLVVTLRLRLIGVVNDIINAIEDNNFAQDISINAYANIDKLQVPINFKYKVG